MPDQQDLFWKGRSGAELRDHALKKFEEREQSWLQRARARMVELLIDSPGYTVSSDNVWALCPPPVDAHPSCMGTIFKDRRFEAVGWVASTRPSAHARVIRTYVLRGDDHGRD